MIAVIKVSSCDVNTPTVLFKDTEYDKAKGYLRWLYNNCYEEDGIYSPHLHSFLGDYASIETSNGEQIEFILTYTSEPDSGFNDVDWKKYM